MSAATILWQPTLWEGEKLAVGESERFLFELKKAFPGREWPLRLTIQDANFIAGMSAATSLVGDPYAELLQNLKRYAKTGITIWFEYGEDHGI